MPATTRCSAPIARPAPLTRALCWAHARRKFFELADVAAQLKRRKGAPVISPIAAEAVRRIDAIFDAERAVNGRSATERLAMRQEIAAPLVAELEQWLRSQRAALARHNPVAGAIDYMLKDWAAFARFLADGRICLTNNAAERALRGVALGRKAWLFAGSDRGGERAAFMYTLIGTAKLNDVDPQAWLADVLARIADTPQHRLDELLPWNWQLARRPAQGCIATALPGGLQKSSLPTAGFYFRHAQHSAGVPMACFVTGVSIHVIDSGKGTPLPLQQDAKWAFVFMHPERSWSNQVWNSSPQKARNLTCLTKHALGLEEYYGVLNRMRDRSDAEDAAADALLALSKPIAIDSTSRFQLVQLIEAERSRSSDMALNARHQLDRIKLVAPRAARA